MNNTQIDTKNVNINKGNIDTVNKNDTNPNSPPKIPMMTVRQIKTVAKAKDILSVKGRVGKCELREQKGGKNFMTIEIIDSTGSIEGRLWNDTLSKMPIRMRDHLLTISEENPIIISAGGIRDDWEGRVYLTVRGLKILEKENPLDYTPSTIEDIDSMYDYIIDCASMIKEPYSTILLKNLKENENAFKSAPAAKRYHDNFRGGLIEHVYKMLLSYTTVADLYKNINKDIMIFIIIKHDFEKINGYTLLPTIEYTDQEELVGHQTMAAVLVYNELKEHNVSDKTILAIMHAILAHHGKLEWGAVKIPLTLEAKLLAHLDYMVSDIAKASQMITDFGEENEGKVDKALYYTKYDN